ncbi:hypothetical protein ED92_38080 [Amycolatopsis sp. MJM2582]|nr:hypothetical protein ED92_38080 [Amycolatopsis sp. MJM2582]
MFNQSVDAIAFQGYVFFTAKGVFERAFGFVEDLKRHATQVFDSLIGILRIEGMDDFRRAATSDINMMAKMASIWRKVESNPEYAEAVSMQNLLKFIDVNEHVEVETVGRGRKRSLVFKPSPKTRYKILKLLDDDFLTSGLTDMDYLVDSKGAPLRKG